MNDRIDERLSPDANNNSVDNTVLSQPTTSDLNQNTMVKTVSWKVRLLMVSVSIVVALGLSECLARIFLPSTQMIRFQ